MKSLDKTSLGQSITEFIVVFPVLLLMLCSIIFFARLLVLKQHSVVAVRYIAWHTARHNGKQPSTDSINALFFNKNSNISISHPSATVGFAGNQLGEFGDILAEVAEIRGTSIVVTGDNFPLTHQSSHTGAQHFVFIDTWKEDSSTGKVLKYALWAIAVCKGFEGSSTSIVLENPSIP